MPFIGQDWRSPGVSWSKSEDGSWEQDRLKRVSRTRTPSDNSITMDITTITQQAAVVPSVGREHSDSECSSDSAALDVSIEEVEIDTVEQCLPHCFVKTGKSKEFVGCTSINEAFCRLELSTMLQDVRCYNYICKVVQILVREKLTSLSASARKTLLCVVEALVFHSMTRGRDRAHCGSPKTLQAHQEAVVNLGRLLTDREFLSPADTSSTEQSVTFADLPVELLHAVLRRVPDDRTLLAAQQAHHVMDALVDSRHNLWMDLCKFHFSSDQINQITVKLRAQRPPSTNKENSSEWVPFDARSQYYQWRSLYFELKKYFGLKELYACMIHICCHCKALFWKDYGHPCVDRDVSQPSVRVTPTQFVDMLVFM